MKQRITFLMALLLTVFGLNAQTTDLIISEYGEGGSFNKWIEIYNGTGATVDLSSYEIWVVMNGGTWPEGTLALSGTLDNGEVYVVCHASSDASILASADITNNTVANFNGDDAVGLAKNISGTMTLIDAIGTEVDPGSYWAVAGTTNGTQNHTLVRKETVCSPNTDWASSAGTDASDSEWIVYSQDDFSYIGSHTNSCSGGTTTPTITAIPSSLTGFTYEVGSGPSTSQSFDISGSDLTADITVTPSASFEISENNTDFQSTAITLTQTGGEVSATTIYTRLIAGLPVGDFSESITCTSTDATDKNVSVSGSVTALPVEVSTLSALRAGTSDNTTLYKFTGEATVTLVDGNAIYMQDATAGIMIYNSNGNVTTSFATGDGLTDLTGTLTLYYGLLEFVPTTDATNNGTASYTPTAQVLTTTEVNSGLADIECELVQISDVTFVGTGNFSSYSSDTVADASGKTVFRVNSSTVDYIGTTIPTTSGNITGLITQYNGTAQLFARALSDFDFAAGDPTIYVDPTSVSSLNYEVDNGPSSSQSISVSGSDLEADITVTAPTNFEVSLDDAIFSSSVTTPMSGAATTVYVRLAAGLSVTTYSGDITLSSTNATDVTVAVSGEVTEAVVLPNAWINEIHYDNTGADVDEFVEIVIENLGTYDIADFDVYLYNGNGGTVYGSFNGSTDFIFHTGAQFAFLSVDITGAQNGDPDGIALSYQGSLIQFLSYEGSFTATDGVANGVTSTEIGVIEDGSDAIGETLQLTGSGSSYDEFVWLAPAAGTRGTINNGQTLGGTWTLAQKNIESDAKVFSSYNTIIIQNSIISPVSIYSLDGKLVFQGQTQNSRTEISIPQSGVYFVRLQNTTTKVIVR